MFQLPNEPQYGPVEYKTEITATNPERLQELATQLKFRLEEGNGEAFYFIGVADNGTVLGLSKEKLEKSIANLKVVTELVGATIVDMRIEQVSEGKFVGEVLIREEKKVVPIEVKVAVLGHVNAGKSTLTGAILTGKLDNGDGLLRNLVARYLHEVVTGRTSSVTMRVLGFSKSNIPVNWSLRDPLSEADVMRNSSKIIRLIDLGGHERYLRTTLKGLMGYEVDYAMLVVASDDGLLTMGKEHLALTSTLKIPMFVVVTKVDKPTARTEEVINEIKRILRLPGINKLAFEVKDERDVVSAILAMRTERVVPIFRVSNVTGEGLNTLLKFLASLPPKKKNVEGEPLGYIDEIYSVPGAGTVVLVTVTRGQFVQGDDVYIGPFEDGGFRPIKIKSIQINRVFVERAVAGNVATLAIQGVTKERLRKGMVVVRTPKRSARTFKARIFVLHHPTTIRKGYVATIHLKTIRQAARFVELERAYLRTGDISAVTLEFLYRPEYLEPGDVFVFREGRTRGIGVVQEIIDTS